MFELLTTRQRQGHRTIDYPAGAGRVPDRLRGRPELAATPCPAGCAACTVACPTGAVRPAGSPQIDLGRCLFCPACTAACPQKSISFTTAHRLAADTRNGLICSGNSPAPPARPAGKFKHLFGKSLALRQVSAGGCNACEADINVLTTVVFDLGRFGISLAASPRHCDGLIITGPVTENMRLALEKTYAAVPEPKLVIAVGACAISGGPFRGLPEQHNGADKLLPVDLYIPGCPPHPLTILDGLLRLLGRA